MIPKVIKNETDYEAALARIDELMDADPGTPEGDELELLVTLVELYEKMAHPIDLPDPVEAIKFRMEQIGLKQKDLVPFIGSRSKVSEVLSGQRPLSISMIRKLHEGLGIPAAVLLREPGAQIARAPEGFEWERFPLAEMLKRNWLPDFQGTPAEAKKQVGDLLGAWAARLGFDALQPVLLRQHVRSGSEADGYALTAWRIRVSLLALEQRVPKYQPGTVTQDFVRDLVRLSYLDEGPLLAREFLVKNGIHFVVETHLPHTHLDGAAIMLLDGSPLVALTLRHDRLDNFWFTLCHELAHIALHFDGEATAFFDDLDQAGIDTHEVDADRWATEALIPSEAWHAADMGRKPSARNVLSFATSLRINPAIPAGRVRKETRNYKVFKDLVGYNKVRKLFT
ncbi:ImmA/IrrE family metallo-endopeptidase [Geobacter sp.]|uniref:ImmA/IrrE family metallo-endopeptidase n=1 Tax=Geobacter sp. TaxID=46610 RepID=UPI001ACE668D|nr:ImmA/IrrE family metallo-endopeptidase [Geobacter sp.]CAG0962300.1 Antitoxin HigA [Anaerolineae bacterium]